MEPCLACHPLGRRLYRQLTQHRRCQAVLAGPPTQQCHSHLAGSKHSHLAVSMLEAARSSMIHSLEAAMPHQPRISFLNLRLRTNILRLPQPAGHHQRRQGIPLPRECALLGISALSEKCFSGLCQLNFLYSANGCCMPGECTLL